MDNLFRNRWFIRIISLLLAVLLWVSINIDDSMDSEDQWLGEGSSEMEIMNNVPIEVRFDSEQYVVSGLPQNVVVTVEGSNSAITPVVRQQSFTVYADLTDLGPGTHEVSLQHTGITSNLTVNIDPKEVEVTIEEKDSKDVGVNVDYINENEIENEYVIGEAKVDPEQVTITGSASVIDRVALVQTIIDVGSAEGTIEDVEAPVKVYDAQGNELNVLLDPSTVEVTVPLTKPKKTVPVSVTPQGGAPEGVIIDSITTETEEVVISGPKDVLAQIDTLSDIPVDVTEISGDQTAEIEIPLPEGVNSVDPKKIEVEIIVDQQAQ
ncbi:CdaR family protein [Halobacillus amylolyticus]|uniref:CdaR family protein n=1 Tax=Halobacillus amylolyticus TaxID=2932259 RepID=A0ABY4H7J4_9BACI|nr:CdaR family protein [Halobacillus amylolyticus]UOR10564.1 CdaR family protein [Halobacillus amylolyticus]